jgi:hypothetical protein
VLAKPRIAGELGTDQALSDPAPPGHPYPATKRVDRTKAERAKRLRQEEAMRIAALDAALARALEEHGLRTSDLTGISALRPLARAWTDAKETDATGVIVAREQLIAAIRALPTSTREVQDKLVAAKEELSRRSSAIPAPKLETLEQSYLDLRAALTRRLSPVELAKLASAVSRLETEIQTASRSHE